LTVELNSEKASLKNSLQRCGGEGRRLMMSMLVKRLVVWILLRYESS
jgi:hypothetical protein